MVAGPSGLSPAPDQRNAGMTGLSPDDAGLTDDDLMTDEEAQQAGALDNLTAIAGGQPKPEDQHDYNLALVMSDTDLDKIGQNLLEKIDKDLKSREDWDRRFKRGLELMGLKDFVWDDGKAPFEGASTAVHPMLAEAVVQSQARLMEEVWPAQGPVKTLVMGVDDDQKQDAADRVASHMNYQLTDEDETYMPETEKLAFYLPMYGTCYRKGYHDFVSDQNVLRYIPGTELIVPYSARSVASAPRKTHRFPVTANEFASGKKYGAYRDIDLQDEGSPVPTPEQEQIDKVEGRTPDTHDDDQEWTFYECDCSLNLPGFEDMLPDQGADMTPDPDDPMAMLGHNGGPAMKESGVALPYTVTLEKESGKILAIRRCWEEADDLKKMENRYAEYWYLPGLGVYGFGLIHMVGSLVESGTDALRALLDSATWANLQGGFKAKDANTKAGELHMSPGVWKDVDMTADELGKAFHTPPVKEPSEALFKLLGFLTEQCQRFCSTTDNMVGDAQAKGAPVGTTIALIEQGSKIYSGVHKRAHFACGVELKILYRLNARYIPEEGYPYQVPGDDLQVFRADYNPKIVAVRPVSDPNIFSQTQRIALAQSEYQLAKDNPASFDLGEILKRMLKAFKDPDPDGVLIDPSNVPVMDPITENIAMATGRPVKAKDGENHDAHLINHMAFAQHPQFGGLPQAQKLLGPAMLAHIAEHVALKYAQVQRGLGVPVPPINLSVQPGKSVAGDEAPQQSDAIAMAAAQQMGAFMQQSGLTMTPPGQDNQAAVDDHHESQARQWSLIAAGLASFAKAGQTLQTGMQAEAAVLGADGNPVQPGAGAPGPARPAMPAAAPAPQPHAPIAPAPPHPVPSPVIPPHQ
jgi:hypothetical protein